MPTMLPGSRDANAMVPATSLAVYALSGSDDSVSVRRKAVPRGRDVSARGHEDGVGHPGELAGARDDAFARLKRDGQHGLRRAEQLIVHAVPPS